jgi:hypothetical protein
MTKITQADVDTVQAEVLTLVPAAKRAQLESDIKAKENFDLEYRHRFFTRLRDTFEAAEISAYLPEVATNGSGKKVASTNPWSAASWNVSEQGRIAKTLGEVKAAAMAKSAGCVLGSTKPNPHFN